MKKVEVLYYEGCEEGLWMKIKVDDEEEKEIKKEAEDEDEDEEEDDPITVPISDEDMIEYLKEYHPNEKRSVYLFEAYKNLNDYLEGEIDLSYEDSRRVHEYYKETLFDAYAWNEMEIDRYFITKFIKEEYGKDAEVVFSL